MEFEYEKVTTFSFEQAGTIGQVRVTDISWTLLQTERKRYQNKEKGDGLPKGKVHFCCYNY